MRSNLHNGNGREVEAMKAIIIGAGIGGLTAAIALSGIGVDVHLFERVSMLREVGAGIALWANAIHALEELGLGQLIRARMSLQSRTDVRSWRGAILSSATSEELAKRYAATLGVLHRADLLDLLVSDIDRDRLHLDHEFTKFSQNTEKLTAHFLDQKSVSGDVLIGADGLHSTVRAQLLGNAPPRYAGYTAWRAVVRFAGPKLLSSETWGPGRRFGLQPLCDARVYWYATKNAVAGEQDRPGEVKQHLLRLFHGWHDPIEAVIGATDESSIIRNDIYDRDPVPRWSDNRVTLLGDAAHPMTPDLGQGACQAIEDSVVLAASFEASGTIDSRLREYEKRRIPRTKKIVLSSRRIGRIAQWRNPGLCLMRNGILRATPKAIKKRQLRSLTLYEPLTKREQELLGKPQRRNFVAEGSRNSHSGY